MSIQKLATHTFPFVTVSELAAYWLVSPQQIRRHIETGALEALRLGPRLYRIPVAAALKFEQQMSSQQAAEDGAPAHTLQPPLSIRRRREPESQA